MKRRPLILSLGGAALGWSTGLRAQSATRVPRVGVLSPGKPPPDDAFHQSKWVESGLRSLGWTPGASVLISYRYAEGRLDRLPALAAELVGLPVDLIVARGLTIAAARQVTATIPIVMAADPDPVRSGFVASLARPGGNITGFSTQAFESEPKQLEFVREAIPSLERVALLTNADSTTIADMHRSRRTASALRLELLEVAINRSDQLAAAFAKINEAKVGAVLVSPALWFVDARQLATLALEFRLPTMHNLRQFAEAGLLMSYGADFVELHKRSAGFVDKILKGANPAELPVEQPTSFELVINLKTAKALGVAIPPAMLSRAADVIE